MTKDKALSLFRFFTEEAKKYVGLIEQHSEISWELEKWIDDVSYQGFWELRLVGELDERKIHSKARIAFSMLSELTKNTANKLRREGCNAKVSIRNLERITLSFGC